MNLRMFLVIVTCGILIFASYYLFKVNSAKAALESKTKVDILKQEISYYDKLNKEYDSKVLELLKDITVLEDNMDSLKAALIKSDHKAKNMGMEMLDFKLTAYDLTYESCGKYPGNPEYGFTRTGLKIVGPEFNQRICAVDPKVIPLHSIIYVEVEGKEVSPYDGVYFCEDTGGGVKGRHVDLFINDKSIVDAFGVQKGNIYILKRGK